MLISDGTQTIASIIDLGTVGHFLAAGYRVTNAAALTAANPQLTKANLQAASFWPVDMTSNAVDVDLGTDAILDAGDVGRKLNFAVTVASGANELTVTSGANITVVTYSATTATSTEDVGDFVECTIIATNRATCIEYAND